MERTACTKPWLSIAALLIVANASAIPHRFHLHDPQPSTEIISPQPDIPAIPEEYRDNKPQPVMRGDGFNYSLYYNYRLTPHLILRPNLQTTTKPGAVSDDSHRFVGGLSAGINF
ncbi:carbohydrate porin [Pseudomonas graminis]